MADEKGLAKEFDQEYGRLSHLAHPSLVPGLRFVRAVDEQGAELWRVPEDPLEGVAILGSAAWNAARCLRRLSRAVGVDVEQGCDQALVTVHGVMTSDVQP
jgi:hypothetical protein